MNKQAAEYYIIKITYDKPPFTHVGDNNPVFYVSGNSTWAESHSLVWARQFSSVKNARSSIETRKRYCRLKDCKCEILKANFTVEELEVVE